MASITIRQLDEGLKRRLRIRAAEHGRSMEEEAREILRQVVGEPPPPANLAAAIRARVAAFGGAEIDIAPREPIREPPCFDQGQIPTVNMIILDTNVVSELLRPSPEHRVVTWLAVQDAADVYLTTVTEAELRYGVAIMPEGRRRDALARAIEGILEEDFRGRILPFDRPAAAAYAAIVADRRASGRPISQFDGQIAAIGRAHEAAIATRNLKDFEGCGIGIIDLWSEV